MITTFTAGVVGSLKDKNVLVDALRREALPDRPANLLALALSLLAFVVRRILARPSKSYKA